MQALMESIQATVIVGILMGASAMGTILTALLVGPGWALGVAGVSQAGITILFLIVVVHLGRICRNLESTETNTIHSQQKAQP
ncbi:hypothetical protein LCGC14_1952200 [marine sediment metagenome]|uniref:Uncharacterized protein n=1 Tax=marine sediment metagenome TaxID=412755 RepID=A0A0F9FHC9_9ZZZZ